jgi:hypothetical protein
MRKAHYSLEMLISHGNGFGMSSGWLSYRQGVNY